MTTNVSRQEKRKEDMATNIPAGLLSAILTDIPLQQQIDRFVLKAANLVPEEAVKDVMSPIGQLIESGIPEFALKEDEQAPEFTRRLDPSVVLVRLMPGQK
jgi:hypothetical protein